MFIPNKYAAVHNIHDKMIRGLILYIKRIKYITGCSAGERYSQGLFSKVLLRVQNCGGGGNNTGAWAETQSQEPRPSPE